MAFAAASRLADLPHLSEKLATLSRDGPGQRALCRLLSSLVGSYIEAFDEEPLPAAVADRAFERLLDLSQASIFEPARSTGSPTSIALQRATSGFDRAKLNGRDAEGTAESDLLRKWSA